MQVAADAAPLGPPLQQKTQDWKASTVILVYLVKTTVFIKYCLMLFASLTQIVGK